MIIGGGDILFSIKCLIDHRSTCAHSTVTRCPAGCDCTAEQSGAGTFVDCKGRGLKRIPTTFPDDARTIDLSDNEITRLDEIQELEQLITLNLANNRISEIDQDFFDDLDALTTLHLSHNHLRFIEDDVFEWGPENLRRFYVDHNRLESITHFTFNNFESLETLDISSNFLFYIDDNAFEDLENLRSIRLHNNSLVSFRPHWFEDILYNSIDITLHDNPWSCDSDTAILLDSNEFDTNGSSKRILKDAVNAGNSRLECSKPESLSGRSLFDLRREEVEDISEDIKIRSITSSFEVNEGEAILLRCEVTGIPVPIIDWFAPDGDEYSISNDDFTDVHMHQDGTLVILHAEDLDDGEYTCTAKNSKHSVEAKTTVSVRRSNVDKDFEVCTYNPVDKTFFHDVEGCVSPVEQGTSSPIAIQTSERNTAENCPRSCECSYKTADCSDQNLLQLPRVVPPYVKQLNFQDNDLIDLDGNICEDFTWLEELLADQNSVTTISRSAFSNCRALTKLTLANNQIRLLESGQFSGLTKLETLDLSGNLIQHIQNGVFSGLVSLERVFLRDNEITQIASDAFHNLPALKLIHLQENKISRLERDWIEGAASVTLATIDLYDNKIDCSCSLKEFGAHLSSPTSTIFKLIKPDELSCSYPISLNGKPLSELDLDTLSCQDDNLPIYDDYKESGGTHFMTFFVGIIFSIAGYHGYQKWKIWRSRQPMPSRRRGGVNADLDSGLAPLIGGSNDDERFV
ncbi:Oidioi.mRNA.OKI2018_I69.chr1.g3260.t1.cds [Oikopleura dioica]|uniref:Oidioi.mRNA.OKI2018_I69.chr1.g3260.t1.cds n=1 Tax=Oikopleura dioica TaxID=34765 RepID=A0ABN7SXY1_OIKDI|nr:Oidioi.mRNA.OKI2018_I69.chr1.g3260.t1.cds [Oikopleura dioica]